MKTFLSVTFLSLVSIAVSAHDLQQPNQNNYQMELNDNQGLNLTIIKFFTVSPTPESTSPKISKKETDELKKVVKPELVRNVRKSSEPTTGIIR